MKFDAQNYPYASKRSVVYAKNGMVCVGNPTAASAGLQTLLKGGNAIDAAITVATCQPVVEPTGNGLGSDCFALIWYKGKLYGINGSGPAPMAASIAALKERGFDKIPPYGVEPINVPGAVGAWMEIHKKFGKLPIKTVMEPSINYAENGYPVSPNMSRLWEEADGFYTKYKDRPEFKGWFDTFEPNGHGITVLMALNILKGYNFTERDTVETMHKQIEAMKLSFVDTKEYVAEPSYMKVTAEQLLSERYAADRRALINDKALEPVVGDPRYSSTVYFCTADAEGNMVSMIQSNYRGFGSGIVVPGTSISFNDRAENFSFDENHPNALQGGKRPYHTIIPAFMTKDGQAVSAFGIMGGFMQPQAHVQVAMNMIDFGLNPQQALDAPRWQWIGGKTVEVEQDTPNHIIRQLQRMGHNVVVQPDPYHMGRGQIIIRDEDGVLCGATEKRTDGQIACF